jgi:hypothetical protein
MGRASGLTLNTPGFPLILILYYHYFKYGQLNGIHKSNMLITWKAELAQFVQRPSGAQLSTNCDKPLTQVN